jgi:hypothetical protein
VRSVVVTLGADAAGGCQLETRYEISTEAGRVVCTLGKVRRAHHLMHK